MRLLPSAVSLLVMITSSMAQSPSPVSSQSGIEGVISISPVKGGPIREDTPNSKPIPNMEFVVNDQNGTVASFTTDSEGKFRVLVPAGHYTVARKGKKSGIGHFGPFSVDVIAGQIAKVDWTCDSGMR